MNGNLKPKGWRALVGSPPPTFGTNGADHM